MRQPPLDLLVQLPQPPEMRDMLVQMRTHLMALRSPPRMPMEAWPPIVKLLFPWVNPIDPWTQARIRTRLYESGDLERLRQALAAIDSGESLATVIARIANDAARCHGSRPDSELRFLRRWLSPAIKDR